MKIDLNNHEFSIVWDGVYYKALKDYPNISSFELKCIQDFINYENRYGRQVTFQIGDKDLEASIEKLLEIESEAELPETIHECTACKQGGCLTSFLCHTTSLDNAKKILEADKLLSAVKVGGKSKEDLLKESRNAANDPIDYFEHIMFSWGNCQAGDRLVMERTLNRMPEEKDLSDDFEPGIRFYFKYSDLRHHKGAVLDGYHALKIKDELIVSDYLHALIVPTNLKNDIKEVLSEAMMEKVHYIENDCKDIWDWSEKVYNYVIELGR
ncbi:phosphate ABC transporter ATPase [Acidaminobacter sp. JC074]|uniref:hypothetical protein n=1 Tax=Acidaminobacter sp. JC074 TaxID=2530199 RepID=UPI001F0E421F|nr:hypothetical protein [Acidaminobacter sp. JC074]MCH4886829.1 phosphate ABC transporter ATPase [Acidaminobacter sp. JC074]